MNRFFSVLLVTSAFAFTACSDDDSGPMTDDDYAAEVTTGMHDALLADLTKLKDAATTLQKAAPEHAWSEDDAGAIDDMKVAWFESRAAYERIEGAIAPLFPDIDAAIDGRYDQFLEDGPDDDLFDGQGATGMHAIERILFVDNTPASVVALESTFPGYQQARHPETDAEAEDFKNKLAAQLVSDTTRLAGLWQPKRDDLGEAFGGLRDLMNEQREKVNLAASDEQESRYAQTTMSDIRQNLAGTRKIYAVFKPWILSKPGGSDIDATIEGSFEQLADVYATVKGDAIPAPPESWSAEEPSDADKKTPFGKLFVAIEESVDPNVEGSAVDGMNHAAVLLGFPEFVEE